jgi:pilus assembly protein Flp/PilA
MEIAKKLESFLCSEEGATATEYAVMIALVILLAIGAVLYLGQRVEGLFNDFGSMVAPYFGGGS